jgi:amino acid transporter
MVLEAAWQGLAVRALIVVPVAVVALRADITKLRAWRERVRGWRAESAVPPPEYRRDNELWRWRLIALAVCIVALVSSFVIVSSTNSPVWLFWAAYAVAMIGAGAWSILGEHVR